MKNNNTHTNIHTHSTREMAHFIFMIIMVVFLNLWVSLYSFVYFMYYTSQLYVTIFFSCSKRVFYHIHQTSLSIGRLCHFPFSIKHCWTSNMYLNHVSTFINFFPLACWLVLLWKEEMIFMCIYVRIFVFEVK